MKNFNPFAKNWRLCKEIFLYRDFSIISNGYFRSPSEDGILERKKVYESTQLNWFEAIQRYWDSESCYVRHKDNLDGHIPLNEAPEKEIEDAEWFAETLSKKKFWDRYVEPYFNARRLS